VLAEQLTLLAAELFDQIKVHNSARRKPRCNTVHDSATAAQHLGTCRMRARACVVACE
jgi:hypothetical protein